MPNIDPHYLKLHPGIKKTFAKNNPLPAFALAEFLTPTELKLAKKTYHNQWKEAWIPDQHHYDTRTQQALSKKLGTYVTIVTGKKPRPVQDIKLAKGSYTLLHDHDKQQPGIIAYLFIDNWNTNYGGNIIFVKNGRTLGQFTPQHNSLLIVERKPGVRSFIQYVNHHARNNTTRLIGAKA